mmetsp:Transcript_72573/g.216593  ORF Transcript_72573/g.216593 Transcript_72573/m.216593 type:complete len:309 (-) Transcript_72573:43-969(-)
MLLLHLQPLDRRAQDIKLPRQLLIWLPLLPLLLVPDEEIQHVLPRPLHLERLPRKGLRGLQWLGRGRSRTGCGRLRGCLHGLELLLDLLEEADAVLRGLLLLLLPRPLHALRHLRRRRRHRGPERLREGPRRRPRRLARLGFLVPLTRPWGLPRALRCGARLPTLLPRWHLLTLLLEHARRGHQACRSRPREAVRALDRVVGAGLHDQRCVKASLDGDPQRRGAARLRCGGLGMAARLVVPAGAAPVRFSIVAPLRAAILGCGGEVEPVLAGLHKSCHRRAAARTLGCPMRGSRLLCGWSHGAWTAAG